MDGKLRPRTGDVVAGISVALVAVPQAIAYARLAGLPTDRGLLTQALAPLAAFWLASSPYIQSGTTAMTSLMTFGALSAVAAPFSERYAALAGVLALIVGLVRIGIGLVRAGTVAYLMSQPVIVGFTTAAGVLICLSQLPAALGVTVESSHPVVAALQAATVLGEWRASAVVFFAATIACILVGRRVHRLFPGYLVAFVVSLGASRVLHYSGSVVGPAHVGLPSPPWDLPWASAPGLLLAGVVIALVGFAEPTAIARRFATEDRQVWNPNREFVSQGLASAVSALGGGYTAGASFSCSALNREAGARTRWSQAVTGCVCVAALPAMGLLGGLPTATLAGITVVASVSLIRPRLFAQYRRYARVQWSVAVLTFVLTLVLAPHIERAVVAGIVLAVVAHLWREMRISVPSWVERDALHVRPRGVLYFASAPGLEREVEGLLARHPEASRLVVHLDGLGRIDLSGALALRDLLADVRRARLDVRVEDVPPQAQKVVARVLLSDDR